MGNNKPVWFLWTKINTQWRSNGFGVIGLDFPAVFEIAKIYDIEINRSVFEKLKVLENKELIKQQKEQSNNQGGEAVNAKRSSNSYIS